MENRALWNRIKAINVPSLETICLSFRSSIYSLFPILSWLPEYKQEDFEGDFNAGLIVFVLLVPQGMAYALLAGVPPVYGLYSATVPLFVYGAMGTCKQISMGPMAITSLLLGSAIADKGYEAGSNEAIETAGVMGIIVGVALLLMGMFKLGVLVNFLSQSVMSSFTTASACIIAVNQIKYFFGLEVPRFQYMHETLGYILTHLDETKWPAVLISFTAFIALLFARNWKRANKPKATSSNMRRNSQPPSQQGEGVGQAAPDPPPAPPLSWMFRATYTLANASGFVCVVVMGLVAKAFVMNGYDDLPIVGSVPAGLKSPSFPSMKVDIVMELVPECIVIAVIAFMGNWAIAKKFSADYGYEVHAEQELIAGGAANALGAMFNGYVVSAGLSRSAVNAEGGARTPLSGVISGFLVVIALLFMTEAFYFIPMAALGAIILVSVTAMADFSAMLHAYRNARSDFYVMVVTFLFTFLLGIMEGIFIGILLSIVFVINRSAFPHIAHLGRVTSRGRPIADPGKMSEDSGKDDTAKLLAPSLPEAGRAGATHWRNIERFEEAKQNQVPGVAVMRMDADIYFANTNFLKQEILRAASGHFHCSERPITLVVLDMGSCGSVDLGGIFALEAVHEKLLKLGTFLTFAHVRGPVRDTLGRVNFMNRIGHEAFVHMSIDDAINFKRVESTEQELASLAGVQLDSDDSFGRLRIETSDKRSHSITSQTSNGDNTGLMYDAL